MKPTLPEFFVSSQAGWSRPVLAAGRIFCAMVSVCGSKGGKVQGGDMAAAPKFPGKAMKR